MIFRCLPLLPATHHLSRVFGSDPLAYVICTRCGKQWRYSLAEMRITRPVDQPEGVPVEVKA